MPFTKKKWNRGNNVCVVFVVFSNAACFVLRYKLNEQIIMLNRVLLRKVPNCSDFKIYVSFSEKHCYNATYKIV